MTRQEIKARARQQLGGGIFKNLWMMALLVCLLWSVIQTAAGTILPGIGVLLLMGPITFGMKSIFLKLARGSERVDVGEVFSGFTSDFGGNFLIGLMSEIFILLWSLLFIVPGIVKSYAYSMAYYVKADHPEWDWKACIDESQRIMKGHKGDLFVLDLSFIGWLIVGSMCCGVGTLWVLPYMEAARANFYETVK